MVSNHWCQPEDRMSARGTHLNRTFKRNTGQPPSISVPRGFIRKPVQWQDPLLVALYPRLNFNVVVRWRPCGNPSRKSLNPNSDVKSKLNVSIEKTTKKHSACVDRMCFNSHRQMSLPGGPELNKFEQVSSDDHQMSLAGNGAGGSQVWCPRGGRPIQ